MAENMHYDAIVVGSGISGGWAAKELTERGLKVLMLERGRNIEHITDYVNAEKEAWDYPHRGRATVEMKDSYPVLKRDYPLNEQTYPVDAKAIKRTALLTIEGELDDISANGQTTSAHELAINLSADHQFHHFQEKTGHYGIFNGRKWREEIMPRIRHFIRTFDPDCDPVPEADLKAISDKAPDQWEPQKHGIDAVNARKAKAGNPVKEAEAVE